MWNCLSSLPISAVALYGMIISRRHGYDSRICFAYFTVFIVGLGSAMFHGKLRSARAFSRLPPPPLQLLFCRLGTLTRLGQALDELPMIAVVNACLFTTMELQSGQVSRACVASSARVCPSRFLSLMIEVAAAPWPLPSLYSLSASAFSTCVYLRLDPLRFHIKAARAHISLRHSITGSSSSLIRCKWSCSFTALTPSFRSLLPVKLPPNCGSRASTSMARLFTSAAGPSSGCRRICFAFSTLLSFSRFICMRFFISPVPWRPFMCSCFSASPAKKRSGAWAMSSTDSTLCFFSAQPSSLKSKCSDRHRC